MNLAAVASIMDTPGANDPINVSQTVAFGVVAAMMVYAAFRVVTTRNVVHAAVWLVVVLAGAAAQFILLAAEFVGVTQVMVYIGAVIVLLLFGVMLTQAKLGSDPRLSRKTWGGGAFVAVVLLGLLSYSVVDTFADSKLPEDRRTGLPADTEAAVADLPDDATPEEVEEAVAAAEDHPQVGSNTAAVGDATFGNHLIPFEVLGVLLTAALVGAVAIARRD